MTIRFPASEEVCVLSTLAAHFRKNRLRARLDQQPRHLFAQAARACSGVPVNALLHMLQPVDRSYASFQNHFAAFHPRPGPDGNLASALQSFASSARSAIIAVSRFRMVQFLQQFRGLVVA